MQGMQQIGRIVVVVLVAVANALAQTQTGAIVGTVTDTSGSAVPNAAVTVTNVDTGGTTKTSTSSSGDYVVTPLPVGHYTVTVEAPGFKKSVSAEIGRAHV